MNSIEELKCDCIAGIQDEGISVLARLPKLRKLSVTYCPQVTRKAFSGFGQDVQIEYAP